MKDVDDIKNVETVTPPQLNKDQDYALVTVLPKKVQMQNQHMI